MPTLRERMRQYRRLRDYPTTPDSYECSELRKLAGAGIVMGTGFVLSAPFGWALLAAAGSLIPVPVAAVLGFALFPISTTLAKYVGGPVADHALGIPREVSA